MKILTCSMLLLCMAVCGYCSNQGHSKKPFSDNYHRRAQQLDCNDINVVTVYFGDECVQLLNSTDGFHTVCSQCCTRAVQILKLCGNDSEADDFASTCEDDSSGCGGPPIDDPLPTTATDSSVTDSTTSMASTSTDKTTASSAPSSTTMAPGSTDVGSGAVSTCTFNAMMVAASTVLLMAELLEVFNV